MKPKGIMKPSRVQGCSGYRKSLTDESDVAQLTMNSDRWGLDHFSAADELYELCQIA